MPNPFWNSTERRIRAGWRILLQAVLFFAASQLISLVILLIALGVGSASGHILVSQAPQDLLNSVNRFITGSPVWRSLMILGEISGAVGSLWLAGKLLDHRSLADFGFHLNRRWWLDFAFGAFLGAILMAFIFIVELAAGWITVTGTFYVREDIGFPYWIVGVVGFLNYISVAVREEIFSRGYHLRNIAEGLNLPRFSPRTALIASYVISSSMFGLFHMFNPNASLTSTLNIIFIGFLLGQGYVLTRELAIPIGLHLTWNFFLGYVFGFPVSGGASRAAVIAIEQGGPEIWTGGAFGPEAGIVALIASAIGLLLTYGWVRWRYGEAHLQESLAIFRREDRSAATPLPEQVVLQQQPR